jgi:hypothetical protein
VIVTERLQLVPATVGHVRAALESPTALSRALGASVPPTWPPEYLNDDALRCRLDKLSARSDRWVGGCTASCCGNRAAGS